MTIFDNNRHGARIEMMQFVLINGVGMFGGWGAFMMCAVYAHQGAALDFKTLLTIFLLSIVSGLFWGIYMWIVKKAVRKRFARRSK